MKIKEVEDIVEISSKNIRFYEKEGLLSPKRNCENGYREYCDSDIKKLKEIKLFRKLGITIEDIRLLQSEEIILKDVLEKQIDYFNKEIDNLNQAKDLCAEMEKDDVSLREVDAELWLIKMRDLERKGARFMNINNDEIIRVLPEKFKMKYYESIIKNGQVDNTLLAEIISYFEEAYKKTVYTENLLVDILKNSNSEEKSKLLLLVKDNDPELYEKISNNIFNFEDIVNIDKETLKSILEQFKTETIVKASKAASPMVNEYLQNLFQNIDFNKEKEIIGAIPLKEVMDIHSKIIDKINKSVKLI